MRARRDGNAIIDMRAPLVGLKRIRFDYVWRIVFRPFEAQGWIRVDVVVHRRDVYGGAE